MEGPETFSCDVCGLKHLTESSYQLHIKGKKHIQKQQFYDKEHKTIFVSRTDSFDEDALKEIFKKFGDVDEVEKHNHFAFIKFKDESSVVAACNYRLFVGNIKLVVRKFKCPQLSQKRKMSVSDCPTPSLENGTFGIVELPIKLEDAENCPEELNLFDWQVAQFVSQVELSEESYVKLTELTRDVKETLSNLDPKCQVLIFGSCGSTLAFKGSDVDLYFQTDSNIENFVNRATKLMRRRASKIEIMNIISKARVPIVKFVHTRSGFQCDITAKSKLGVCNTNLIRVLILSDERLRPLMMLIKYWGKVCGVSVETPNHSTFTCYSLVLMVIFYLQQCDPPILHPITVLQQLAEQQDFTDGWLCSFCDNMWTVQEAYPLAENKMTVKELLLGFFEFYHDFDFTNVICPLLGVPVHKAKFEEIVELPDAMQLYKDKVSDSNTDKKRYIFQTKVMVKTQDPFELAINATKNVSDNIFFQFKNALKCSLEIAQSTEDQSLLQALFSIDKDSLNPGGEFHKFKIKMNLKKAAMGGTQNWFQLQVDSIMMVLERVLKFKVEQIDSTVSNKVQKLNTSEDVYTSPDNQKNTEVLTFSCTANCDLWTSRALATKEMKPQLKHLTSNFEKECFISDHLHTVANREITSFSFKVRVNLKVNHELQGKPVKESMNHVEVVLLKNETDTKDSSGWKNFLTQHFRYHILFAEEYILSKSKCSAPQNVGDPDEDSLNLINQTIHDNPSVSNARFDTPSTSKIDETNVTNETTEVEVLPKENGLQTCLDTLDNTFKTDNTSESVSSKRKYNTSKSHEEPEGNVFLNALVAKEKKCTSVEKKTVEHNENQVQSNNNSSIPKPPLEPKSDETSSNKTLSKDKSLSKRIFANLDKSDDKTLYKQNMLLASLNKKNDTLKETNTLGSVSSMKKFNEGKFHGEPLVNSVLKKKVETATSDKKTFNQMHPKNTFSIPKPPHEILLQNFGEGSCFKHENPLLGKETKNQSNPVRKTEESYANTVREVTNRQNKMLNNHAVSSMTELPKKPQYCHKSRGEIEAKDRTPIEKQNLWYPSLK